MIEIRKSKKNTYRFYLKTSDGNTLFRSVDFVSEEEVKKTVKNLSPLASRQAVFERKTNYNGKFLFNLKDNTGRIIGKSTLYGSEAGMENGIANIRHTLATTPKFS